MRVFCRVTAGLEEVISYDLEDRFPDINISEVKWRQISFSLPNANDVLGPIPTVDDIYIFVGDLKKVHHTRSELPRISSFAKKTGYLRHVEKLNKFRSLPERPTFYVTVSRVGKHNYSSPEIREIFIKEIEYSTGWESEDRFEKADINFRIIIEHDNILIGLSLFKFPLHRRKYKKCHIPGSLKPPVAHLICKIIGCNNTDILVDPMCGAGTTIIEATHLSSGITAYGSDRSLTTINCAKENWGAAFPHIKHNLFVADVLDFPIQRSFATKFITNLPWGRQVTLESSLSLYDSYFKLILKLGTNNFVSAVLTDRTEDFLEGLRLNPNIHLLWGLQFSLLGSYPYLYILGGPHWLEKKEALNQISPLGERIITLIERKGVLQRYSLSK